MDERHSSAAERLLLSFAGVAAVYTDALADYAHRGFPLRDVEPRSRRFGMPVVEALASGTRVAHNSDGAMNEITKGLLRGLDRSHALRP